MEHSHDPLADRLLAAFADRIAAGGEPEFDDLLAQAPAAQRPQLARLFELVRLDESAPRTPIAPLLPGLVLGGCRLIEEIGRGGMATVWRAEQLSLHREVALKVLRPGLALDPRQAQRLRREALAIAQLDHPNIVRVHEVGRDRGHLFLVMERVEGGNLARWLAALPPPAARGPAHDERVLARLFAPIARALAAAHAHGIVHRDLKPSNVLLRRDGTPVLADFGLAKGEGELGRTLTGAPLGTPHYMSPEQVEQAQAPIDGRTDIWSLGVTLFEALAGERPFEGPTALALFDAIRHRSPRPLQAVNPRCSAAAAAVVAKAMARRPADRYATADDFAADLEALAEGRPVAVRGPSLRGLAAALADALRRGEPFEWRSPQSWRGVALVHVAFGRRGERRQARGWIAIGDRAVGLLAIGTVARGVVAIGSLAFGVVAAGALAVGGVAIGGGAVGGVAIGGVAVGGLAIGGCAAGGYALGGKTFAREWVDGVGSSEEGERFFKALGRWGAVRNGWLGDAIRSRLGE